MQFDIIEEQIRAVQFPFIKSNNYATSATFELTPYKLHNLSQGPPTSTTLESKDAVLYYRQIKTIRDFENAAAKLYKEKKIYGFCHLSVGQEAVGVGLKAAMRPKDCIISSYRVHGLAYLMGVSVVGILAELTGRKSGCSRGKGGSMHMYAKNFFGGNGIVGSQVPLGAGVAFASHYRKDDAVCFTLYGDGASNNGQVFEAFNLAKLLNLPAVFICENNLYGMGTPAERSSSNVKYYKRGDVIPGLWVNGMGVLDVREAARFAIKHMQAGQGPLCMEIETYRYHGHSMSDPGTSYRTREEIAEVRKLHDPLNVYKAKIISAGLTTEEELKKIDAEVKAEVASATNVAKTDTEPPMDEIACDIYSMPLETEIRGTHPWSVLKHKRIGKTENL